MLATCRATTAAPTFFRRVTIHGRTFVDGAFGHTNNPTRKAHFHFTHHVAGYKECPTIIWINIGTGSPKVNHDARSLNSRRSSLQTIQALPWRDRLLPRAIVEAKNLIADLEAIATDSDRIEDEMEDIVNSRTTRQHIDFMRVSANNRVAEIALDDWRSLDKIEELTHRYLRTSIVQEKLRRIAKKLAVETHRRRMARARDGVVELDGNVSKVPMPSPCKLKCVQKRVLLMTQVITVSKPARESQHLLEFEGLTPLDPSPISPIGELVSRSSSTEEISGISPVSTGSRGRTLSRSSYDLLASLTGLPGMSIPNVYNENRFSNVNWDTKWKRRTTVF